MVNGRQAPAAAPAQVRLIANQVYVAPRIQGNFLGEQSFWKEFIKENPWVSFGPLFKF